jgi:hypothetical protein
LALAVLLLLLADLHATEMLWLVAAGLEMLLVFWGEQVAAGVALERLTTGVNQVGRVAEQTQY